MVSYCFDDRTFDDFDYFIGEGGEVRVCRC